MHIIALLRTAQSDRQRFEDGQSAGRESNAALRWSSQGPFGLFIVSSRLVTNLSDCKEPWLRAVLAIAYAYGFGRSEIVGRPQRNHPPIKVSQVDMTARTIRLNPSEIKNDDGRVVKMTQEVYDLLKPCIEGKSPEDAVFTWKNGKPVKDFHQTWRRSIEASEGVPSNLSLHDFRRSAARNLLRAGVNQDVGNASYRTQNCIHVFTLQHRGGKRSGWSREEA
jgi:integrase